MADSFVNYRLIVSDYDGTLVGRDRTISSVVEDEIKKWIKAGKKFTIATGRQYEMISGDCLRLGITAPVIVRGGAEIVDPKTDRIIFSKLIEQDVLRRFVKDIEAEGFDYVIESGDTLYSTHDFHSGYENVRHAMVSEFDWADIPKMEVFLEDRDLQEADRLLEEFLKKYPELSILRSYNPLSRLWDVTSIRANKHIAVLELFQILDVDPQSVIGIGDGHNDYPLLTACGYKVAMGNAPDELKAIADEVVPRYQEDGVAKFISKLLE